MVTARMDDWNPPELWKRITCIIMIRAGHQNKKIMFAAQCSLNTMKTIRNKVEGCNGDYEAVATKKQHKRRSDSARSAEFLETLKQNVLEDPSIGIRALSRELNISPSTMKLALNEDLRYYSYKRRKGQSLTEKARENRLTKAKKLLSKVKYPAEAHIIWFFFDEKISAKIRGITLRITDGLQTVQRTLFESCRLNFPKLLWFSDVCLLREM